MGERFQEALTLTGVSVGVVLIVLVALTLLISLLSWLVSGRRSVPSDESKATSVRQGHHVQQNEVTRQGSEEDIAAIFGALHAAGIRLPVGGRIRIEEVSSRRQ